MHAGSRTQSTSDGTTPVTRVRPYARARTHARARARTHARAHARSCALTLVLALAGVACAPQANEAPATDSTATPAAPAPTVTTVDDPAQDADGTLRVLVYHDMEGLAGQDDPNTFRFSHPDRYVLGREYLVADLNAVIAGLFDGGADEVHVVDAHGSGNPEPDVMLERLDGRAQMVFRDRPFRQYVDLVEEGLYDAVAVVGMHAKTGSGGFASHTYTLGMDILMNGMSITETEIIAFSWGRVGVPVIFASGDDRLREDLEVLPWIEFVVSKTATSASTASLRPPEEVHAEMRERAAASLRGRDQARAVRIGEPVIAELRVVPPASLAMLEGVPGIQYEDETVSFLADDFQAAYDGVIELIGVARAGYADVLWETLRQRDDFAAIQAEYSDRLFERWLDFESGRWSPPVPQATSPSPEAPAPRFHGAR